MPLPGPAYRTKTEFVAETLREQIVTLALAPGSRVKIDELARNLSVSTIPVREAVARLASERFIAVKAHIGPQIATIDRDAIHDVFALMTGLETAAVERVCENLEAEALAEIEGCCTRMEALNPTVLLEEWCAANVAFHLRIVAVARLPLVEDSLRLAFEHWRRIRLHYRRDVGVVHKARIETEHRELVELLRKRDASALSSQLALHNRHALDLYLAAADEAGAA
ncbi:GntR family transcriptional regulator [Nibricoccus sp. IMCC34717]|uniref:GntR family transcriptional regulator n=1 Tax=Nibricoccus sp. IMCC34717 TaxID=3034021 RepID=UPI00384ABFD7